MGYRIIYFFAIFIVFISLIFLSQKRNTKNKNLKVKVNFRYDNGKFLDSQMVNKLLIQREDTTFFLKEDMLDLKEVEDLLISNPMIATADIFRTPQGILSVKLEERKPIVRVINNQEEFYLDNIGHRVPLSKKYSARVPIFYGKVDKNLMDFFIYLKV